MTTTYVKDGVTFGRLPLISRDDLESFDSNPEIHPFSQAFAPSGTAVDMNDLVKTNTRTFVGVGKGLYVTYTKTDNAPNVYAGKVTICSHELGCFMLLVAVYIMCVYWHVAVSIILGVYILLKLGIVGAVIRLFLDNPGLNGVTISGPTGTLTISV